MDAMQNPSRIKDEGEGTRNKETHGRPMSSQSQYQHQRRQRNVAKETGKPHPEGPSFPPRHQRDQPHRPQQRSNRRRAKGKDASHLTNFSFQQPAAGSPKYYSETRGYQRRHSRSRGTTASTPRRRGRANSGTGRKEQYLTSTLRFVLDDHRIQEETTRRRSFSGGGGNSKNNKTTPLSPLSMSVLPKPGHLQHNPSERVQFRPHSDPWDNDIFEVMIMKPQGCPICLDEVAVLPQLSRCGHVVCLVCAERMIRRKKIATGCGAIKCPVCTTIVMKYHHAVFAPAFMCQPVREDIQEGDRGGKKEPNTNDQAVSGENVPTSQKARGASGAEGSKRTNPQRRRRRRGRKNSRGDVSPPSSSSSSSSFSASARRKERFVLLRCGRGEVSPSLVGQESSSQREGKEGTEHTKETVRELPDAFPLFFPQSSSSSSPSPSLLSLFVSFFRH